MKREHLSVLLFVASAASVIGVSAITKGQTALDAIVFRWVGLIVVAAGMLLAGIAMKFAEGASHGAVAPVLDRIVTRGPYRVIRHPMYLGFLVSLVGVAIAARSYFGLACVFLLFLPAAAFRGRLEEQALSTIFGEAWHEYVQHSWFMIPWLW